MRSAARGAAAAALLWNGCDGSVRASVTFAPCSMAPRSLFVFLKISSELSVVRTVSGKRPIFASTRI